MLTNWGSNAHFLTTVSASKCTVPNTDNIVTTYSTFFCPRSEYIPKTQYWCPATHPRCRFTPFHTMHRSMKSSGHRVQNYLGAGKIHFLPLQPRTSQKQVYIQGKTALSFAFLLGSNVLLITHTNTSKR